MTAPGAPLAAKHASPASTGDCRWRPPKTDNFVAFASSTENLLWLRLFSSRSDRRVVALTTGRRAVVRGGFFVSDEKPEPRRPGLIWRGHRTEPAQAPTPTARPVRTEGTVWRGVESHGAGDADPTERAGTPPTPGQQARRVVWRGHVVEAPTPQPESPAVSAAPLEPAQAPIVAPPNRELVLSAETSLDDLFRAILGETVTETDERNLQRAAVDAQIRALRNELDLA